MTIPTVLVDELRQHLAACRPAADSLVFTGERGATPRRGNWRANVGWTEALVAAGLPEGFHFHDLRHTGNHLVAQSGASTRELMHADGPLHDARRADLPARDRGPVAGARGSPRRPGHGPPRGGQQAGKATPNCTFVARGPVRGQRKTKPQVGNAS